jgi:hypothetical protein
MGVAPTGREIRLTGIAVSRIANGKIQEKWDFSDVLVSCSSLVGPLAASHAHRLVIGHGAHKAPVIVIRWRI